MFLTTITLIYVILTYSGNPNFDFNFVLQWYQSHPIISVFVLFEIIGVVSRGRSD